MNGLMFTFSTNAPVLRPDLDGREDRLRQTPAHRRDVVVDAQFYGFTEQGGFAVVSSAGDQGNALAAIPFL